MTDNELTEFAAKAIGLSIIFNPSKGKYFTTFKRERRFIPFDPLNLDGDALRLAHGLNVPVSIDISKGLTTVSSWDFEIDVPHGNDPLAATRRAIVKSAAAIGESL